MEKAALYAFMKQHRYGVISSVAANGAPQSALVGIAVTPYLKIVFDTVKTSRKYPNLIERPDCSFVIGWAGEQTVQFEGAAEEISLDGHNLYHEAYFAVWPECRAHIEWPQIAYFVIHPKWIRYSDYDQRPPLIQELRMR